MVTLCNIMQLFSGTNLLPLTSIIWLYTLYNLYKVMEPPRNIITRANGSMVGVTIIVEDSLEEQHLYLYIQNILVSE